MQTALSDTSGRTIFKPASTDFSSTNTTTSTIIYRRHAECPLFCHWRQWWGGFRVHQRQIQGHSLVHFDRGPSLNPVPCPSPKRDRSAFGAALRVPRLNWVVNGFYGYYYQAPPFVTATGPLLDLANGQSLTFSPLHGERDIQWQYGVTIPFRNWTLNANNYETRAENWLDHNNIGESNIFWPITWSYAQFKVGRSPCALLTSSIMASSTWLREPDRAGDLADHRGPDLPGPGDLVMPA